MTNRLLTQVDLAARWNVSPRTLERWRWEGCGPPHLKIGSHVRYRLSDVEAFENGNLRDREMRGGDEIAARDVPLLPPSRTTAPADGRIP